VRRGAALAGLCALVLAAGCGGGSGPLTKEELIAKGDETCSEGNARFAEIQAEPPVNAAEAANQAGELIDVSTAELADLRDLEPPEELSGKMEAYLAAQQRAIDDLERGRDAANDQDKDAYAAAQERSDRDSEERQRLARAIGFHSCSKR